LSSNVLRIRLKKLLIVIYFNFIKILESKEKSP
jgi:hypothetical protein